MLFGLLIVGFIFYMIFKHNGGHFHHMQGQCQHGAYGQYGFHGKEPLDILKTRLAKGEITVEEYEKIKQNLE